MCLLVTEVDARGGCETDSCGSTSHELVWERARTCEQTSKSSRRPVVRCCSGAHYFVGSLFFSLPLLSAIWDSLLTRQWLPVSGKQATKMKMVPKQTYSSVRSQSFTVNVHVSRMSGSSFKMMNGPTPCPLQAGHQPDSSSVLKLNFLTWSIVTESRHGLFTIVSVCPGSEASFIYPDLPVQLGWPRWNNRLFSYTHLVFFFSVSLYLLHKYQLEWDRIILFVCFLPIVVVLVFSQSLPSCGVETTTMSPPHNTCEMQPL